MPDKNLVKKAFSRAASTYDKGAGLQREVCHELAALARGALGAGHEPRPGMTVLDVGAGTGELACLVSKIFPCARVFACDIATPMLVKAKAGRVSRAVCADFDGLPFADDSFDAVVSSLTYQWADAPERAFKEARRVLRSGGGFIFSTLGPATLHEMRESFKAAKNDSRPMLFSTARGIRSALEAAGFEAVVIDERPRKKVYDDLCHLLKTLKNVGALGRAGRSGLANPRLLKDAGRIYAERFPAPDKAGIIATYDVIFASARRI